MSCNSVSEGFLHADKLSVTFEDINKMEADEVYRMLYPEKHADEAIYKDTSEVVH